MHTEKNTQLFKIRTSIMLKDIQLTQGQLLFYVKCFAAMTILPNLVIAASV